VSNESASATFVSVV